MELKNLREDLPDKNTLHCPNLVVGWEGGIPLPKVILTLLSEKLAHRTDAFAQTKNCELQLGHTDEIYVWVGTYTFC